MLSLFSIPYQGGIIEFMHVISIVNNLSPINIKVAQHLQKGDWYMIRSDVFIDPEEMSEQDKLCRVIVKDRKKRWRSGGGADKTNLRAANKVSFH